MARRVSGGRSRGDLRTSLKGARSRLEKLQGTSKNVIQAHNPLALDESEHEYFLTVATLIYLFYRDDGEFSKSEKKEIKKEINNSKSITTNITRKELKKMLKKEYDEAKIQKLTKDYKINKRAFNKVIKMLEEQFASDSIHLNNLRILSDYIN